MERGESSGKECEEELLVQLMKEIMSLERERKDLLHSLTPTRSIWKQLHSFKSSQAATPTWTKETTASVQKPAAYLDSILEDAEDLGHRMLSMAYVLDNESKGCSSSSSSYRADELVSTTSRLMHVSEEFYNNTCNEEKKRKDKETSKEKKRTKDKEKELSNDFMVLCSNYLQFLYNYDNELALIVRDEQEEKEEKQEEEAEEEKDAEEEDEDEEDTSTMEFLESMMDFYASGFVSHHACWERIWGSPIGRCGAFDDTTTLSSMHFTHCTPDTIPSHATVTGSTLQIYSIEIKQLSGSLNWPLKVSGVVAARDTVDRNRNILFSRSRHNYQILTEKDPFLLLTGPSRAILALDPVDFEVELKINEGAALIRLSNRYDVADHITSLFFHGRLCTVELSLERIAAPLQATVMGVRVVEGDWPFKHGCRVFCSLYAAGEATSREVVLLDYDGKQMRVGCDGYLHLSRNVVSVELQGTLRVVIQAYSESVGRQAQEGHIDFPAQQCQTRKGECFVGNSKLEIVVAWYLLVKEKLDLLVDCPAVERSAAQA